MDPQAKQSVLTNLIGTPEIKVSLTTKTILSFFAALVVACALIFLINHAVKKI